MDRINQSDKYIFLYNIYRNIICMLRDREFLPTVAHSTYDEFFSNVSGFEFIHIKANTSSIPVSTINTILIVPGGKYAKVDVKMKDLMKKYAQSSHNEQLLELIFITNIDLGQQNIAIRAQSFVDNNSNNNTYIRVLPYTKFFINFNKSMIIPKHEIVPKNEADKLLEYLHISDTGISKILEHDTAVVWLGAKPGDLIKIHRCSGSSLINYHYRIVVGM